MVKTRVLNFLKNHMIGQWEGNELKILHGENDQTFHYIDKEWR